MSARDKRLLKTAGISVSEAGRLFGRTRQAVHAGIAQKEDYFASAHIALLLNRAKRLDSDRLPMIIDFVESNYGGKKGHGERVNKFVLLPFQLGASQLLFEHVAARPR